jgi:LCP family protein required for cell wall assembly
MRNLDPQRRPYRTARERVAARRALRGERPRRRRRLPTLLLGGAALVALVAIWGLWGWAGSTLRAIEQVDPRQAAAPAAGAPAVAREDLPATLQEPFNVLLVGVDRRDNPEEGVRGDTLILVHVNPAAGWAGMLSIPRDSVVQIPNVGMRKINYAYTYGFNNPELLYGAGTPPEAAGGALAAETVALFLGVKVDYIAQVDFRGFQRVVDTIGGITVDVARPILDPSYPTEDYGYERLYIPAGLQLMDGATALRYARTRHSSSDFDRSARQQQVLRAILDEVRARGLLSQAALLPGLARDLQASVSTTLPLSDLETLAGLAAVAQGLDPGRIISLSLNPNDVRIAAESGSDIFWDQNDVLAQVGRLLAGPAQPGAEPPSRVQVLNGAGVQGLATRITRRLAGQGFPMNDPGDAPGAYPETRLIDYSGRPQALARLADALGLDPARVYATPPADAPPAPFQADLVLLIGADYDPAWAGQ